MGNWYISIRPLAERFGYLIFAITRSSLTPAGTSPDFVMYQRGKFAPRWLGIPFLHSSLDFAQPTHELATRTEPFEYVLFNNTKDTQTFDMVLHAAEFSTARDWDEYRAMVEIDASILRKIK